MARAPGTHPLMRPCVPGACRPGFYGTVGVYAEEDEHGAGSGGYGSRGAGAGEGAGGAAGAAGAAGELGRARNRAGAPSRKDDMFFGDEDGGGEIAMAERAGRAGTEEQGGGEEGSRSGSGAETDEDSEEEYGEDGLPIKKLRDPTLLAMAGLSKV